MCEINKVNTAVFWTIYNKGKFKLRLCWFKHHAIKKYGAVQYVYNPTHSTFFKTQEMINP